MNILVKKLAVPLTLLSLFAFATPAVLADVDTQTEQQIDAQTQALTQSNQPFVFEKSQSLLSSVLDRLENHLQKERDKINALAPLNNQPQDNKSELLSLIDGYFSTVKELRADLQNAHSKEDLKAVATKIHSLISTMRLQVKKTLSKRMATRIESFEKNQENKEQVFKKAEEKIQQLKQKGQDVTNLEQKLQELQQMTKDGDLSLEAAKERFDQFENVSDNSTFDTSDLTKEGVHLLRQGREKFKHAHEAAKDFEKELRSRES